MTLFGASSPSRRTRNTYNCKTLKILCDDKREAVAAGSLAVPWPHSRLRTVHLVSATSPASVNHLFIYLFIYRFFIYLYVGSDVRAVARPESDSGLFEWKRTSEWSFDSRQLSCRSSGSCFDVLGSNLGGVLLKFIWIGFLWRCDLCLLLLGKK